MRVLPAIRQRLLRPRVFAFLAGLSIVMAAGTCTAGEGRRDYLSDLADRLESAQEWGQLGLDVASYGVFQNAAKLGIGEKKYAKGLGHAPGWIEVDLEGLYDRFEAEVGVQAGAGEPASVVFQVLVDGKKVFDSGVMKLRDPPRTVNVSVRGAQTLRLVVTDAGDGISCDQANWADARLIRADPGPASPAAPRIDMAQFARVVSFNPDLNQGPRWNRAKEFPAEDLFLAVTLDVLRTRIPRRYAGLSQVPSSLVKCRSACGWQFRTGVRSGWWQRSSLQRQRRCAPAPIAGVWASS